MRSRWIFLALCFGKIIFFSNVEAQESCDMDKIVLESRPCTRGFLDKMIKDPKLNCSKAYKNMTSCLHDIMFKSCFDAVAENVPRLKPQLEQAFGIYASSISTLESASCGSNVNVNISNINPNIKRFIPCKQEMYNEGPACTVKFIARFNHNRTDPELCGLYDKAKKCEAVLVKKYCTKETASAVDMYNPFCKKKKVKKVKKKVKSNHASTQVPGVIFSYLVVVSVFVAKLIQL